MNKFTGYCCSACGTLYAPDEVTYTCTKDANGHACGGNLDVLLDLSALQRLAPEDIFQDQAMSLWRYLPLLPVSDPGGLGTPIRAAGWTPVYHPKRLADELGFHQVWVKDEAKNPTASFKDRASAVVVARAREIGAEVIVTASTGNAGAALAGMAAAIGHPAVIFAPRTAPPAKIAQLLVYGARVILVDGNYDSAVALAQAAAEKYGWYCRNTGYNPFTVEGKKTAALEIWEYFTRLGETVNQSLAIFVSVGDGNIISGIHKGFKDLFALGWIGAMPRIYGVQSTASAAIANAYLAGTEIITPVAATTLADSISVDKPSDGLRALRAATQTGGAYVVVSDEQIMSAIPVLGAVGIFAEPAGSAALAGLIQAKKDGLVSAADRVLVINTGSGLKDVRAAMAAVQPAPVIEPTLEALARLLAA